VYYIYPVYDSLDRLTREKHVDVYGQIASDEKYEFDLAGNRTKKTVLDSTGNPLVTVGYTLGTGNRLASWTVAETNLMACFPVAGYASETIGANDRFGALWVSNAVPGGMSVKPVLSGTNFLVDQMVVSMGTQTIVAAIRDVAGNTSYVTNTVIPTVVTNGAYQYNTAGCLTNIQYKGKDYSQSLGLTWNGQYQLTAATTNGAVAERYGYDAAGRRLWVWDGTAGTNWFVYDGNQVVADLNSTGGLVRSYVWGTGIDSLLSMTVYGGTTNTYYALKDHLGSVLALTDGAGNIVESYRYDAWGRTTVYGANGNELTVSAIGNRYCWQGREYSFKTGLYYFRARWADPVTGRWLSPDPLGISGGLNLYAIMGCNTANFKDPFGLCKNSNINRNALLKAAQNTSLGNSFLGLVGFGLLFTPAAPAGGVVLATTGVIGVGLGVTETGLSGDWEPAAWSVGGYFVGGAVGRNVPSLLGLRGVEYNWGAARYYGTGGRFVPTQVGRNAYLLGRGSDQITSTTIEQFGDTPCR